MAPSLWKGLVGIGLFALAHAAFSAAQHYFPSSGIKWKMKCEFLQSSSFQDKIFRSMYYVYDRSYMRLTEKEDESLPIDIVLQTLLAFAVTCYGIVHIAGEFKDMDATSELKNKLRISRWKEEKNTPLSPPTTVLTKSLPGITGEGPRKKAVKQNGIKTFDTLRNHPSFYVFNHRGRVLFRPSDTTNSSNQDALSSNTSLKLRKLESLRR